MPMLTSLPGLASKRSLVMYVVLAIAVVGLLLLAYVSYEKGAQKNLEADAAHRVAAATAKSENPFQADNPLAGVGTNPFEKTKKIMNPFEN